MIVLLFAFSPEENGASNIFSKVITNNMDVSTLAYALREALLPIPFILCVLGFWEALWHQATEVKAILGAILRVLIVAVSIWQYPNFIDAAEECFSGFRKEVFDQAAAAKSGDVSVSETEFKKALMAPVNVEPSALDFTGQICAALIHSLQGLGQVMLSVLLFLQQFCLEGLIAISPILLGFLGWNLTRSMGIQFCFTTVGILLWEVGVLIVDVLLLSLGEKYLNPTLRAAATIGVAGAITGVASWPLLLSAMVIAALIPAFLYLSVPFIIATVLRGGDPTAPLLLKAMQLATMASGASGAMVSNLARTITAAAGGSSLGNLLRGGSALATAAGGGGGNSLTGASIAGNTPGDSAQAIHPAGGSNEGVNSPTPLAAIPPHHCGSSSPSSEKTLPGISLGGNVRDKQKKPDAQAGEVYVGKHGHIFKQLTPKEFSCQHPQTGFTSQHEGNIGSRQVADTALLHHNRDRMVAGDMGRKPKSAKIL
ncbi:MAG: hypothetical protein C5B47_06755 [Verrucomicrobia bacterium]|nr:MAG: hypothetical protein C5B47_06755 [Verrucomicrobiota bacterium]